jgi:hypothetical protein
MFVKSSHPENILSPDGRSAAFLAAMRRRAGQVRALATGTTWGTSNDTCVLLDVLSDVHARSALHRADPGLDRA